MILANQNLRCADYLNWSLATLRRLPTRELAERVSDLASYAEATTDCNEDASAIFDAIELTAIALGERE
jgi:hypothetical protein